MASGCESAVNEEPFKLSPVMTQMESKEKLETSKQGTPYDATEEVERVPAKEAPAAEELEAKQGSETKASNEDNPSSQRGKENGEAPKTEEG